MKNVTKYQAPWDKGWVEYMGEGAGCWKQSLKMRMRCFKILVGVQIPAIPFPRAAINGALATCKEHKQELQKATNSKALRGIQEASSELLESFLKLSP
jgi:hypothetical protein